MRILYVASASNDTAHEDGAMNGNDRLSSSAGPRGSVGVVVVGASASVATLTVLAVFDYSNTDPLDGLLGLTFGISAALAFAGHVLLAKRFV